MRKFLFLIFLLGSTYAYALDRSQQTTFYKKELEAWKLQSENAAIFNKEVSYSLRLLQTDIANSKKLSWRHLIELLFIGRKNIIMVTADTMPRLYHAIQELCQKADMKTPSIFLTINKGILNASAFKLLKPSGSIILHQKIVNTLTDQELEGVITHELGHIKYNHVNKGILLSLALALPVVYFIYNYWKVESPKKDIHFLYTLYNTVMYRLQCFQRYMLLPLSFSAFITKMLIGKRFEREADAFAYETMGKGNDLLHALQINQLKEHADYTDIEHAYKELEKSRLSLNPVWYKILAIRLWLYSTKFYLDKWLFKNTPFGSHPPLEERIATVEKYLALKDQLAAAS